MGRLGETLKARRRDLGLTLDQVESATKIRRRMIEALEEADWERLPDPGYVRGYVSSYARLLDLDPLPLLAMLKSETGTGRRTRIDLPADEAVVAPTGEQHALPWRPALAVVVVIALLAFSVWAVTRLWRGPEPPPPVPAPVSEPTPTPEQTKTPSPVATEALPAVGAADTPASEFAPFTLEVKVAANGASWVTVKIDGKSAYAGTLTGGQSKTFEVTGVAEVNIGRPSVTTVYRDGKQVEVPESDGTSNLTLKAEPASQ